MDFMNLAEVPEVESVQDGDTVFVVRNGEVCRVAKDKVGGGAGGYVVNVAKEELIADEDGGLLYITTPVPGLLEAAASGAVVTVAGDVGLFVGEEEIGANAYITTLGAMDMGALLGEEDAGYIVSAVMINGECANLVFTNGQAIPTEASVATLSLDGETAPASLLEKLRSKLGGGTNAVV